MAIPAVSLALFLLLAYAMDRDLFRYPLVQGRGYEREQVSVAETIRKYDAILIDFYDTNGVPALLNEFPATKAMRHAIFRDIGFLRDTGRTLVQDMADLTPVDVKITSYNTAEAVMLEQINYQYQRGNNRMPITEMKGMGCGFRYYLIRENNQWVVSEWDPVFVEEPINREFLY